MKEVLHPIFDKLGISRKGRRVGFHAFRHSLASLPEQTTGIKVAQTQAVPPTPHNSGIYTHVLGEEQMAAMTNIESVLLTDNRHDSVLSSSGGK